MSVSAIAPIGAVSSLYPLYSAVTIPLQSANGFSHIYRTEQVDQQGRTMSITEVELRTYDRFARLQTIPSPHYSPSSTIVLI